MAVTPLAIIYVAVVWPSEREVSELKNTVGPGFLSSEGEDITLSLVMLAPAIFCVVMDWQNISQRTWVLVGCVVGPSAEMLQSLLPVLERRPSLANAGQSVVGAWIGALVVWYLLCRSCARPVSA